MNCFTLRDSSSIHAVRRTPLAFALFAVCALSIGCGTVSEDPILRLSGEEALEIGKQYLEDGKYQKARRHLVHAFEVEPNSRNGREALLLAADALYLQGGSENYIRCEAKYRDFLNRFPTSDQAAYAQYRVGACLGARSERPDRDQKMTESAIEAYEELLRLYPSSEYAAEARQSIRDMTNQLAAHEMVVGVFYNRYAKRGICQAAIARFEYLRETYPTFDRMDEVLYQSAISYERCNRLKDAVEALAELRRRYPESEWLDEAAEWEVRLADKALEQAAAEELVKAAAKATAEAQEAEEGMAEDDSMEETMEDDETSDSIEETP